MSGAKLSKSAAELLAAMKAGERVTYHPYPGAGGKLTPYYCRADWVKCTAAAKSLEAAGLVRVTSEGTHYSRVVALVDPAEAERNREAQRQAERNQRAASEWRAMHELLVRISQAGVFDDCSGGTEHMQSEVDQLLARIEGGK